MIILMAGIPRCAPNLLVATSIRGRDVEAARSSGQYPKFYEGEQRAHFLSPQLVMFDQHLSLVHLNVHAIVPYYAIWECVLGST